MDLPNEIIREICSRPELEKKDLRSLRLTSKHLCESASYHFAKECFGRVSIMMYRPSLEAFIELSQHPYFGPAVEMVTIYLMFDVYLTPALLPPRTPGSTDVIQTNNTYSTTRRKRRRPELITSESAERLLSVAFKAFAQRQQSLKLHFSDDGPNAIGVTDCLYYEAFEESSVRHRSIAPTIRAVTSHGCKITGLLIDDERRLNSLNDPSLYTDDIEQQLSSLCSNLAYLDLMFWYNDTEFTSRSLKRMVSAARNLRSLNLMRQGEWDYSISHYLPEILKSVASTSLETIMIDAFRIPEPELFEFLGRQSGKLRDLHLMSGCILTGSCMSLIAWIRDNLPGLMYLELWEICTSGDHDTCDWTEAKSYRICRGEDMQACLTDILNGRTENEVKVQRFGGTVSVEGNEG
jgi:hypothetical protein